MDLGWFSSSGLARSVILKNHYLLSLTLSSIWLNWLLQGSLSIFLMAEDSTSEPTVRTFPRHKAATIGRQQGDKRRAMANLPSWNEVNAMYSDENSSEGSESSQDANRRWSMFPTTSTPLQAPSPPLGTQFHFICGYMSVIHAITPNILVRS